MAPTNLVELDRYNRQEMVWGAKGQKKLKNSSVAIVGLDSQGLYTALCLTALGVGNISLIDGDKEKAGQNFLGSKVPEKSRAVAYSDLINLVNPTISINPFSTNLETRIDELALQESDIIVETTNLPSSKRRAVAFSQRNNIPVLSTSNRWGYTKLMLAKPGENDEESLMPMFQGQEQDDLMALLFIKV